MVSRILTSALVVVIIGGVVLGVVMLRNRNARNEAARLAKKEDISITIVEGKRREEIAALMDAKGITSYDAFLTASKDKEGYLFPDTYRFFANTPASEVVARMEANFNARLQETLPTYDELVLASIIEREAVTSAERPIIAGVYTNRLNANHSLDADPTVQYGKDTLAYLKSDNPKAFEFWKEITRSDYQGVESVFNTYRNRGLPPAPIANPGKESIIAAKQPASHGYFFFAHRDGKLILSTTLTEHETKLRAFRR